MGFFDFLNTKPQVVNPNLFISFAIEDKKYRDYLVAQANKTNSPFNFTDMSVKRKWPEAEWQERCTKKISRCNAVIVLLSNYTYHASGARWEMKCANELGIKLFGMHIRKDEKYAIPPELKGKKVIEWNWQNLEKLLKRI